MAAYISNYCLYRMFPVMLYRIHKISLQPHGYNSVHSELKYEFANRSLINQ